MDNQQLAEGISEYEALTRHLDGDFDFDRTLGTNALALASGVIDMNYEGVRNIFPIGKVVESLSFPNPKLHEAYSSNDLSLLTNDIKDIKVALNAYLVLANTPGIRPRAEIEMPQLVSKARELIDVLKKRISRMTLDIWKWGRIHFAETAVGRIQQAMLPKFR